MNTEIAATALTAFINEDGSFVLMPLVDYVPNESYILFDRRLYSRGGTKLWEERLPGDVRHVLYPLAEGKWAIWTGVRGKVFPTQQAYEKAVATATVPIYGYLPGINSFFEASMDYPQPY